MQQLEAGMLQGRVLSAAVIADATRQLAAVADEIFDTLAAVSREATGEWLHECHRCGGLPRNWDTKRWFDTLGVIADYAQHADEKYKRWYRALETLVGEPEAALALETVELCFAIQLPSLLRHAWQQTLGNDDDVFTQKTILDLMLNARNIAQEHSLADLAGRPYPVLPFARDDDHGFWVLDLSRPTHGGDYRTTLYRHDTLDYAETVASSRLWLRDVRPLLPR